jgi:hypothetical protein
MRKSWVNHFGTTDIPPRLVGWSSFVRIDICEAAEHTSNIISLQLNIAAKMHLTGKLGKDVNSG